MNKLIILTAAIIGLSFAGAHAGSCTVQTTKGGRLALCANSCSYACTTPCATKPNCSVKSKCAKGHKHCCPSEAKKCSTKKAKKCGSGC